MQFGNLRAGEKFNYVIEGNVEELMKIRDILITRVGHKVNAVSLKDGRPFFISDLREVKPPHRK